MESNTSFSIAVLISCFNRRDSTLSCLANLFSAAENISVSIALEVYLVDDASTDGTTVAVEEKYPDIRIIEGDGSLFWGGAMHLAFSEAIQHNHDFYLWLNDDTTLFPDAIDHLISSYNALPYLQREKTILIGSTKDPFTGELSYGGVKQHSELLPLHFKKVVPTNQLKECHTMNGNCVLIPKNVVHLVGVLDSSFSHYGGDFDYGLRAKKVGCFLYVIPGYVGNCASSRADKELKKKIRLEEVITRLFSPKGLVIDNTYVHPLLEWLKFTKRHGRLLWIIYFISPYRRVLIKLLKDSILPL